jgi:Secretion system C-terminal sorting domain/PKD domain
MKTNRNYLLLLGLLFIMPQTTYGQCSDCLIDSTCVGIDGFPAVCPDIAETAYTNAYYEQFLTFFIPTQVTDPGSGFDATLLSVEVVSVVGLPFGLEFTLNDDDGIFYPSQGENYGCATICGTPLIQGVYNVQIAVDIIATAFGFEITQSESFPYTIIVEPGKGGTGSFTVDNSAGCGNLVAQFEAILAAPLPSVTTYAWSFGNGSTSTDMIPPSVPYNAPGTYTVALTTTISDFKLEAVETSALSDNWGGDIDDILSTSDTYFTLTDGEGSTVFTSDVIDNNNSPSWQTLGLLLSNPPYSITFFDEDDISADDNLGNLDLQLSAGANSFTIPSGTAGSITINLDITTSVTDSTDIIVFEAPEAIFWINGTQLYFDDPSLSNYQWYINGQMLSNETAASIEMSAGGEYSCEVVNLYGCAAWSNSYLYCPTIAPTYDPLAQEVSVEQGFESYQWFYNGESISGANNYYQTALEQGNYSVLVTTEYGCTTLSNVVAVTSQVDESSISNYDIYPNPSQGPTYITGLLPGSKIQIFDAQGKLITSSIATLPHYIIDSDLLNPGVYTINISTNQITTATKLIKL